MQPFTLGTLGVLVHGAICFFAIYFLFQNLQGWIGIICRSMAFLILFCITAFYFKLSPDLVPLSTTLKRKLGL